MLCNKEWYSNTCIGSADIHIPGSHNIENILTVIALAYALSVPIETIHRIISEFHGVEHRLERVKTLVELHSIMILKLLMLTLL